MNNFQIVILAGGFGHVLYPLCEKYPKSILPVNNMPLLSYQLNFIEKYGFLSALILTSKYHNKLERELKETYNGKVKYEIANVPEDKRETADALKFIQNKINKDFILISSDTICDVNLDEFIEFHILQDSFCTLLLKEDQVQEETGKIINPSSLSVKILNKNKFYMIFFFFYKDDFDIYIINDSNNKILYVQSHEEIKENGLKIKKTILANNPTNKIKTNLFDAHIYICKREALTLLCKLDKQIDTINSFKSDFIPFLVKNQYNQILLQMLNLKKKKMSQENEHLNEEIYQQNIIENNKINIVGYINKNLYARRCNNLKDYFQMNFDSINNIDILNNNKNIKTSFEQDKTIKINSGNIGENSFIGQRVQITKSIIGLNCKIQEGTKISNCVIMNGVIIESGFQKKNTYTQEQLMDAPIANIMAVTDITYPQVDQVPVVSIVKECEYEIKCEQLQDQVIISKISLTDTLQSEINLLKNTLEQNQNELLTYKETLRKMHQLYTDQENFINDLKLNNTDLIIGIDKQAVKNLELIDDIKNAFSDKNLVCFRLEETQKQYDFEKNNIKQQLENRDNVFFLKRQINNILINFQKDILSLRRKVNNLIEVKRRVEEDKENQKFEINHLKDTLTNEQKEKEIAQLQFERAFNKMQEERNRIINDLTQKMNQLQQENNRLVDENRIQLKEIKNMINDIQNKQNEINRYKEQLDNYNLDINEMANNAIQNAMKSAYKRDMKDFHKKKTHDVVDNMLDFFEDNVNNRIKLLAMNLWKTQYKLRQKDKQIQQLLIEEKIRKQQMQNLDTFTTNYKTQTLFLVDICLKALQFIREQITKQIYQVFETTLTTANKQKHNALVLFLGEMSKLKQWKGMQMTLDVFHLLKQNLKSYLDEIRGTEKATNLEKLLELNTGDMKNFKVSLRDNMNKIVQDLLIQATSSFEKEKIQENSNIAYLFRLMAIKRKIYFPGDNKELKFDEDLLLILDDKICDSFREEIQQK
ncbi:nucleotidyl transferase family protein, putative [Ichthyophthirius multifiliis]|uniref:Translation initiation factor eIF2B subunit gamma n=1 Tax=Ichthyophthirius multifiliis TaxID=5932 RepID=G0R5V9_ICHMU|nr:nucleotidyl transferase family protein, putative [Ichthyophthirius multifiliis]EGR27136.1 nucleotidyl transferase family protein, putative [Ichthyophthirius multifiliis]|eukprot:XP_004024020.1 nucleotidyl transferase family protein, putative [Ichthyophthirius multifiliis]